MRTLVAIAFAVIVALPLGTLSSQEPERREQPSAPRFSQAVVEGLLEQSYITAPGRLAGDIPNLLFEANVAPPFYITAANRLVLVGTPKVLMRMLREKSLPVRTPSYMPRLSAYLRLYSNQFIIATVAHHSNGQEDPTKLPNGDLNLKSGNFSTSYVEGGIQGAFLRSPTGRVFGYRATYEYHPDRWTNADIRGLYPPRRIRFGLDEIVPFGPNVNQMLGEELQLTIDLTWYMGGQVPKSSFGPARMGGWYTLSLRPSWLRELTLFLNAYVGPDYYNIHFLERLNVLRIGLGTRRSSQPFGPVLRTPS